MQVIRLDTLGDLQDKTTSDFDIDKTINELKQLNIPFIHVDKMSGCFSDNDTIMITVSIEYKSDWTNGYLQNSQYANFHFDVPTMKLEKFSGCLPKMRKCKIKDASHLCSKILDYCQLYQK